MHPFLVHLHSGLRWVVLITILLALFQAIRKWSGSHVFDAKTRKIPLFAFISCHLQLLAGLVLYAISPRVVFSMESMKNAASRFFLVEHTSMMLLAIVLITLGYLRAKKVEVPGNAFRTVFWFYLAGMLLILASIPWPSMGYGTGWF